MNQEEKNDSFDIKREVSQLLATLKTSYNELEAKISKTMFSFSRLSSEVERLKTLVENLKTDNTDLKREISEIKDRLSSYESILGSLKSDYVQRKNEKRELLGGSITSIQPQDLLNKFRALSVEADALLIEVILNRANTALTRSKVQSNISIIFRDDINLTCDEWIVNIFKTGSITENTKKLKKQDYNRNAFINYFNDVKTFKEELAQNSNSSLFFPQINSTFEIGKHNLISQKCDESKLISIVVFPGLLRGEKIEEKATVYTDIGSL